MFEQMDDVTLLLLLKNGDKDAFDAVFKKHASKVYYFAMSLVNNTAETEDIVQETFLKIWEERAKINETRNFNAWISVVVKNTIYDLFRHRLIEQKYCESLRESLHRSVSIEHELHIGNLRELLAANIEKLPPQQREILIFKSKGFANAEIAQLLGISKRTVEVHLHRSYKNLKNNLGEIKYILPVLLLMIQTL